MERNNILESVKSYCEISETELDFDDRMIDHINGEFATLFQNGAGPEAGFAIHTGAELWCDFTKDVVLQSMAREYIKIGAKLAFDPPQQGTALLQNLKEKHGELEWRIREHAERWPL